MKKTDQIIELLVEIRDMLKKAYEPSADIHEILVHESVATCPECECVEVSIQHTVGSKIGECGHPIYTCKGCELVWVNNAEALVDTV